eukprot:7803722-Pyramimonas_sp.AAC.1
MPAEACSMDIDMEALKGSRLPISTGLDGACARESSEGGSSCVGQSVATTSPLLHLVGHNVGERSIFAFTGSQTNRMLIPRNFGLYWVKKEACQAFDSSEFQRWKDKSWNPGSSKISFGRVQKTIQT